jgi:hypothetical protein
MKITIHNVENNEIFDRDMSLDELALWEIQKAEYEIRKQAKAEAEARRLALLDKLGITADEAKLLLGGN